MPSTLSNSSLNPTAASSTLSTQASSARPSHKERKHTRSISHPFPAFLRGSRKKSPADGTNADLDSTDEESIPSVRVDSTHLHPNDNTLRRSKSGRVEDRSVETGHCMTCDSKVKWPAGLKVFRCAACLTINDREPAPNRLADPGVGPLSVERTRAIIDRCLDAYLAARCQRARVLEVKLQIPDFPPPPKSPQENTASSPSTSPTPSVEHSDASPTKSEAAGGATPAKPTRLPPPPPPFAGKPRAHSTGGPRPEQPFSHSHPQQQHGGDRDREPDRRRSVFKPLEDFIIATIGNHDCINAAFSTLRPALAPRTRSESAASRSRHTPQERHNDAGSGPVLEELDAKTLLLGDLGDNASWWSGRVERNMSHRQMPTRHDSGSGQNSLRPQLVNHKSPCINWTEMSDWYNAVLTAGCNWRMRLHRMQNSPDSGIAANLNSQDIQDIDEHILEDRIHVHRTLLKVTENVLKRPGRPLKDANSIRFLLILISNPLLYPNHVGPIPRRKSSAPLVRPPPPQRLDVPPTDIHPSPSRSPSRRSPRSAELGQHSGIIKRILGLFSNLPVECHRFLVTWFSRFAEDHYRKMMELVSRFVSYRLSRNDGRKRSNSATNPVAGLIPELMGPGSHTSAQLHAALGLSNNSKSNDDRKHMPPPYSDDWQLKSASKVMSLLFAANNIYYARRPEIANGMANVVTVEQRRAMSHGQLLPTSAFYNTLLDYLDLIADFDAWEAKRGQFAFCQYPFFLSIGAKIRIMEYDARRQMESMAREAFFDSILTHRQVQQYFNLKIRRDCLVDDSLRRISESVGSGGEELKKGLKVHFIGEEGVDAGGLRKEWFLLLVREVFDPNHGLFIYDSDSQFCYFNPTTFETSDQFFLVGALLGLAIYNSTILDVALPPFAFKKLLAAAPAATAATHSLSRTPFSPTLEDLAEYRPALANGLRQLLEFEGDVESTFCRDFVVEIDRYGKIESVPLLPNGENRAVTNSNRQEFVDLYVRYLLDVSVSRQFEPFKRGFFTVCGGNALSLFRPEEIELLVRGSDAPLNLDTLRGVAVYDNWIDPETGKPIPDPATNVPVLRWFWEFFEVAGPPDQRRILSFITGSDRIPAVGAASLIIKISCLGDDCDRYPTARTCFNQLCLWNYGRRAKFVEKLWGAVTESEGFGLK